MPGIVSRQISDAAREQTRSIVESQLEDKRRQELLVQQQELEAKAAEAAKQRQFESDQTKKQLSADRQKYTATLEAEAERQKAADTAALGRQTSAFQQSEMSRVGYNPLTMEINKTTNPLTGAPEITGTEAQQTSLQGIKTEQEKAKAAQQQEQWQAEFKQNQEKLDLQAVIEDKMPIEEFNRKYGRSLK